MFFICLLSLAATAIAGSAAFFSVYGLAHIFSGTFWSVVVMGSSLEAGKLIAASYLYRYWSKTGLFLKSYLILGVVALMILTSTGILGYLSVGYLSDSLPLEQLNKQVDLLNSEKDRLIDRKKQIDQQIAALPTNSVRGRTQLMKQFKDEEKTATDRITALDQQTLEFSQKQMETQAHVGPIIYIAKAFGLQPDDATKYLIAIIIFAFDPMAVALTLAVNIALRIRKEEKLVKTTIVNYPIQQSELPPVINHECEHVEPPRPWPKPAPSIVEEPQVVDRVDEPIIEPIAVVEQPPIPEPQEVVTPKPQRKSYLLNDTTIGHQNNVQELIRLYQEFKSNMSKRSLTGEEQSDFDVIEQLLADRGLLVYID